MDIPPYFHDLPEPSIPPRELPKDHWLFTHKRRIAYDMHLPENYPHLLEKVDPPAIARRLAEARVNGIQLFAKNHWGTCFWPCKTGRQHEALKGRDLFGEMLESLHQVGIKCSGYLSDYQDNLCAAAHPDWQQVPPAVSRGEEPMPALDAPGWRLLCPNSPYQQYLISQIEEIARGYDVDAIFVDMVGFCGLCCCEHCRKRFKDDTGLDLPEERDWSGEAWRTHIEWRYRRTYEISLERREAIHRIKPGLAFIHNYHGNSYHHWALSHEPDLAHRAQDYVTVETAPWHMLFGRYGTTLGCKFVHAVSRGEKPREVMGARSFGLHDFTCKPQVEENIEALTAIAHDVAFGTIDMGDIDNLPEDRSVEYMRTAHKRAEALEPFTAGSRPIGHVGVLYSRRTADFYGRDDLDRALVEYHGFMKACFELHLPVVTLLDQTLTDEVLAGLDLVVLPDAAILAPEAVEALRRYVAAGGGLLATHRTSSADRWGEALTDFALADVFGASLKGEIPQQINWLRQEAVAADWAGPGWRAGTQIRSDRSRAGGVLIEPADTARVLALRMNSALDVQPELSHFSHGLPAFEVDSVPMALASRFGEGRSVYLAIRTGELYARQAYPELRRMLSAAMTWAAGRTSPVTTDAPMAVELIACRKGSQRLIHLANHACRPPILATTMHWPAPLELAAPPVFTPVVADEVIPIHDIHVDVDVTHLSDPASATARSIPDGRPLQTQVLDGGRIRVTLERLDDFASILVE